MHSRCSIFFIDAKRKKWMSISIGWAKEKYATEGKNREKSKEKNCIEHKSRTGFNVIQWYSTIKFTFSSLSAFFSPLMILHVRFFFHHFILDNLRIFGNKKESSRFIAHGVKMLKNASWALFIESHFCAVRIIQKMQKWRVDFLSLPLTLPTMLFHSFSTTEISYVSKARCFFLFFFFFWRSLLCIDQKKKTVGHGI